MGKLLPPLPRLVVKAIIKPPEPTFTSGSSGADSEVIASASGLQSLEDNLRSLGAVAMDAAGYEMAAIMREVVVDSQENYVPVDSGDLKDAADSDEYHPGTGATITKIAAWYAAAGDNLGGSIPFSAIATHAHGGEDTSIGSRAAENAATGRAKQARLMELHASGGAIHDPHLYARDQHENVAYKHGLNWSGTGQGQAKYLETPFNAKIPEMGPRIADAVAEALGMSNLSRLENDLRTPRAGYGKGRG